MKKTLSPIGNSLGLILDKPLLDLLGIDRETTLEITTDGTSLTIRPVREEEAGNFEEVARGIMERHKAMFEKLAE